VFAKKTAPSESIGRSGKIVEVESN